MNRASSLQFATAVMLLLSSLPLTPLRAQLLPIQSVKSDLEQGAQVAKQVEEQIGLYAAPQTDPYLPQVGQRLATREPAEAHRYSMQVRPTFVRLPRRTDAAHP